MFFQFYSKRITNNASMLRKRRLDSVYRSYQDFPRSSKFTMNNKFLSRWRLSVLCGFVDVLRQWIQPSITFQ